MGRFEIITGNYEDEGPITGRGLPPTKKIVRIQEWKQTQKYPRITLEISPKTSTCRHCNKNIEPGYPRYVIWNRYFKRFYHKKCLPRVCRKIINSDSHKKFNGDTLNFLKQVITDNLNNLQYTKDRNAIRKDLISWMQGLIDHG